MSSIYQQMVTEESTTMQPSPQNTIVMSWDVNSNLVMFLLSVNLRGNRNRRVVPRELYIWVWTKLLEQHLLKGELDSLQIVLSADWILIPFWTLCAGPLSPHAFQIAWKTQLCTRQFFVVKGRLLITYSRVSSSTNLALRTVEKVRIVR